MIVSAALQPGWAHADISWDQSNDTGFSEDKTMHVIKTMHLINEGRLLGLNFGDWSILIAGLALTGSLTLFV